MSVRVYLERALTPELLEEALPLVRALHLEVEGVPLPSLNVEMLGHLSAGNALVVALARDEDRLVGFLLATVAANLTGTKLVIIEQTYLLPEYRAKGFNPAIAMFDLMKTFALGAQAQLRAVARGTTAADFYVGLGGVATEVTLEFPK
jgi:GNAT superfamily N-acetyltransferase